MKLPQNQFSCCKGFQRDVSQNLVQEALIHEICFKKTLFIVVSMISSYLLSQGLSTITTGTDWTIMDTGLTNLAEPLPLIVTGMETGYVIQEKLPMVSYPMNLFVS